MTTDWLKVTISRLHATLDRVLAAMDTLEDTIVEILQDLAGRNAGYDAHDRTIGDLTRAIEDHSKRLGKVERKLAHMEGRQAAEDQATAALPWWRDWWAVTFMLLTVVPVTLALMLALGLMTPDQASQAAQAAVEGLFNALGLSD